MGSDRSDKPRITATELCHRADEMSRLQHQGEALGELILKIKIMNRTRQQGDNTKWMTHDMLITMMQVIDAGEKVAGAFGDDE